VRHLTALMELKLDFNSDFEQTFKPVLCLSSYIVGLSAHWAFSRNVYSTLLHLQTIWWRV